MKSFVSLVSLVSILLSIPAFSAELKVGTVNMRLLLNSFHETQAADAEAQVERDNLRKKAEERMTAINALQEELKKLDAEFKDPSLAVARRKKVAAEFGKRQESLKMLGRDHDEFLQRSNRALQEKMRAKTADLRIKVIGAVQAYAATQNVDYVFDGSGLTSSQVPFLLYVREPVDITEGVLKELNKDAPAEFKKKAEAKK